MLAIPLAQVANQSISFNADGVLWTIHLYQTINFVCADIMRSRLPSDDPTTVNANGQVTLVSGVRCFGGIPLLQYAYLFSGGLGNFCFDSDADWTEFGASCNLYYLEQDELATFTNALASGVIG
jgi:hypothetical protein